MSNKEKISPKLNESPSVEKEKEYFLILHNDDVNTFDFVIDCLVDVCAHDLQQAEQCAYITHYKGKCDIKKGEYDTLSLMKECLDNKGLTVSID